MGFYYTLCHNTYAYSLLFYKVYMKRENAGSWNSGLEKEQILEAYSAQLQKSWNSTEHLKINKEKYSPKMKARGPTPLPRGWGRPPRAHPLPRGPPGDLPTRTTTLYNCFRGEKIGEKDSSRFTIRSRRQALKPLGRADLESVRGSGEGNPSPLSSLTFLHHQFHDAHRRAWVIPS